MPFEPYLKALNDIGYRGFLTIEREVGDDPTRDILAAVEFLQGAHLTPRRKPPSAREASLRGAFASPARLSSARKTGIIWAVRKEASRHALGSFPNSIPDSTIQS